MAKGFWKRRAEPEQAAPEPIEGRPPNHAEREATASADARDQEAAPSGTIENENALSDQRQDFYSWLEDRGVTDPDAEPNIDSFYEQWVHFEDDRLSEAADARQQKAAQQEAEHEID